MSEGERGEKKTMEGEKTNRTEQREEETVGGRGGGINRSRFEGTTLIHRDTLTATIDISRSPLGAQ